MGTFDVDEVEGVDVDDVDEDDVPDCVIVKVTLIVFEYSFLS